MAVKFMFVHFCIRHLTGQFLTPPQNAGEVGQVDQHLQAVASTSKGSELAGDAELDMTKQQLDKIYNAPQRVYMNALRPGELFDMYVHVTNRAG